MTKPITYKSSGVDIDAADTLFDHIKDSLQDQNNPNILSGIGGFGALFAVPQGYKKPVLIPATDGVGTKLKLAIDFNRHQSIGVDLVAMCVNDIITTGGKPLFFLDYFATSKLDVKCASSVMQGIIAGCKLAQCSLVGGETAEMPGLYQKGDYDLAGFAVGIAEQEDIITPDKVQPDDVLLGIASSGIHSNGYSMVRKILDSHNIDASQEMIEDKSLIDILLEATHIYVKAIAALQRVCSIHAICHITGGGITENLPRVLPKNLGAMIDLNSWSTTPIFHWLQDKSCASTDEMLHTFNCGLGMVLAMNGKCAEIAQETLKEHGFESYIVGNITQHHSIEFSGSL